MTAFALSSAWAQKEYDFSAVAPTGQTLYYKITSPIDRTVEAAALAKDSKPAGSLAIPSTVTHNGTTYSVTAIGESAFCFCESLTSIIIPNSVTTIGAKAFYNCTSLTSITIPNSVITIGEFAFTYCTSITSVAIPNSVTTIGDCAFAGCESLTSITIPNSVTAIGDAAFEDCASLSSVIIPNSVTAIGGEMFRECGNLTSVTIPNTVTTIGEMAFAGCERLTSITIPNAVTAIGNYAFHWCYSLATVSIPNTVTAIGNKAFFLVRNVIYHGSASGGPWSAQTLNGYEEGDLIFSDSTKTYLTGCKVSAKNVIIPNSVTSIGGKAFMYCSKLTSVTIPNAVTTIEDSAFVDCTSLTDIAISNSVTSIGKDAFVDCTSLASITIPNSVTSIGNDAFYAVKNIFYHGPASGSPWGARTLNGHEEGDLFYSDSSKTHLTSCKESAKNVIIPNTVTSIGDEAFLNCNSLTSIIVPNTVTSIGYNAFYAVKNIFYHGSASGSPWGALTLNGYEEGDLIYSDSTKTHLTGCKVSATEINIPYTVTSIGNYAFAGCDSIASVTIPNSVTTIGDEAFYACASLKSVTILNSATAIGEAAFPKGTKIIRSFLDKKESSRRR